ncbi:pyridoxamine 5'-phosphate oxidase-domain-containing protein [Flammula alnicola]|nr:pyridoxamine 5'-phosphate oxidase-domain-containing protein [Flammula alnicola]
MTLGAPRWKVAIEKAIAKYNNQTVIQIATIDSTRPEGSIPRVRSHVFREFLDSPTNPALSLLLSSTDIRTPKVRQLTSEPKAEVVWWIEGTNQQFRFIADIYVVPTPTHPLHSHFTQSLTKAAPGSALALFKNEDWESKRVAVFNSMSARLKAGWCRPVPGTRIEGGQEEAKKWPERLEEPDPHLPKEEYEEAKRNWDKALSNFALVIIDPIEIDFVDLQETPDRRTLFTKKQGATDGVWEEEELVP